MFKRFRNLKAQNRFFVIYGIFPVLAAGLAACPAAHASEPVYAAAEFGAQPAARPTGTKAAPAPKKPGLNPYTLIAGTALAVWAAAGNDFQASAFATRHTPLFGSGARARQTSDMLQNASIGIAALIYTLKYLVFSAPEADNVTFAYTATRDFRNSTLYVETLDVHQMPIWCSLEFGKWSVELTSQSTDSWASTLTPHSTLQTQHSKLHSHTNVNLPHPTAGIVSGVLAFVPLEVLKRHTARPRPDGSDTRSYPSGHTTAAAWANGISAGMLSSAGLPAQYEIPARTILTLMTVTTAYSRVEGGKHYPGDVFAGAFLGSALADASMTLFGEGDLNGKLSITLTGMTSTLYTTVDF